MVFAFTSKDIVAMMTRLGRGPVTENKIKMDNIVIKKDSCIKTNLKKVTKFSRYRNKFKKFHLKAHCILFSTKLKL